MTRVPYEVMVAEFSHVLQKHGFTPEDAQAAAVIFAQNSLAGVYGHGLNRFPRLVSYLEKGEIDPKVRATCTASFGNNPLIMAVPRSNGMHAVVDCAMSQFSYGKIENTRLNGAQLPVPGGYNSTGELTTDPGEFEETWRVLPMGYWKGSGLSVLMDLMATILSNGHSVSRIGTFEEEVGLTQIMIAIDPTKFNTVEQTDAIAQQILEDIKKSEPITEGGEVFYPGERSLKNMKENMELGIPVIGEIWESVRTM